MIYWIIRSNKKVWTLLLLTFFFTFPQSISVLISQHIYFFFSFLLMWKRKKKRLKKVNISTYLLFRLISFLSLSFSEQFSFSFLSSQFYIISRCLFYTAIFILTRFFLITRFSFIFLEFPLTFSINLFRAKMKRKTHQLTISIYSQEVRATEVNIKDMLSFSVSAFTFYFSSLIFIGLF